MIGVTENRRFVDKVLLKFSPIFRSDKILRKSLIFGLIVIFIVLFLFFGRSSESITAPISSVMLRQPTTTTTCAPNESRALEILKRDEIISRIGLDKKTSRPVPIEFSTVLVIMTHDRVDHLKRTLESVLRAKNVEKFQIIVSMDSPRMFETIRETVNQTISTQKIPAIRFYETDVPFAPKFSGIKGCTRHVGSILRRVFETEIFEYMILLEDDLLVSVDFFDYFSKVGILLHPKHPASDGLFCISAWHDHAFKDNILVFDESNVIRTNWYPGLGVMFHKSVWLDHWRTEWPFWDAPDWNHDQWIRYESSTKNKDCVAPEVPRTHHLSTEGLHVDSFAQTRYDRMILAGGNVTIRETAIRVASDPIATRDAYLQMMKGSKKFDVKEILRRDLSRKSDEKLIVILNDITDSQGSTTDDPKLSRELFTKLGIFPFYLRMFFRGLLVVKTRGATVFILLESMKDYWQQQ